MIKIENDVIPFRGYLAMTVWPLVFVRRAAAHRYTATVDRHERTHARQQKEMLAVGLVLCAVLWLMGCGWWSLLAMLLFFWWYLLEWGIRLCILRNGNRAYRAISFEQEAYSHEGDPGYLDERRWFAWVKYLFNSPR